MVVLECTIAFEAGLCWSHWPLRRGLFASLLHKLPVGTAIRCWWWCCCDHAVQLLVLQCLRCQSEACLLFHSAIDLLTAEHFDFFLNRLLFLSLISSGSPSVSHRTQWVHFYCTAHLHWAFSSHLHHHVFTATSDHLNTTHPLSPLSQYRHTVSNHLQLSWANSARKTGRFQQKSFSAFWAFSAGL